ncbi:GNAT family N-acetyltransferase [Paenibacillus lautus]|uniref:GNAT family N-acetyltransferase n=1 Tax=Paenibacillus lautus TaxID=1401 RepID=UPI002DB567ED|nr:GNAT family N-acetyltransferase [Paenibacillus lautus]MEC0255651.1 GNAT family N-acetyltransferase [Paenibacillus lautus]MEC0305842.1 GNAT family N-acetyltransferase [Paenibacillus lautus]
MNPILLDFPTSFTTERLLVRMPLPGDGKIVYESIKVSINELKEWMPFAQNEQTEQMIESNIRDAHAKFLTREDLRLLIFHKETNHFIGSSGLHRIDWNVPKFEIGYWIDSRFSGSGFMTEAVQGITDFAFSNLKARRVEIRCDSLNLKSKAIPERLGFQLEGTLRNDDLSADGSRLRSTLIFAKIQ